MKIIKHSTITIDEIEIGVENTATKIINGISKCLKLTSFGLCDVGEPSPDFFATIPGKVNYSNCIVEGGMEMWDGYSFPVKKYNITQDGFKYGGVMPILKMSDNVYECVVDYIGAEK